MRALAAAVARRSLSFGSKMAQPHAEGSMNYEIVITRYREQDFDEESREHVYGQAIEIYRGIGGFSATRAAGSMELGDERAVYEGAEISIPVGSRLPRIDDVVKVISGPDNRANGREFKVDSVQVGGRLDASVTMQTTGLAPSREWRDENDVPGDL